MILEHLLSKLPWIKEKVVKIEAKNSHGSYVVDFSGLDPSPVCAPFEKELRKCSAQRCMTVLEIASYLGRGAIVNCKEPYLREWMLQLNNTPHTNVYTMKVEQRRPRLKPEDIYAVAHKDVSKREAPDRLQKGDQTTVTCTHRPSPHKTAVNAVNADAETDPNTAHPTDTSFNAVGHPEPPAKKTAHPGSKPPPSNKYVWVPCSRNCKQRKKTDMDYCMHWGVTNSTSWTGKPDSPCNDSHWAVWGTSMGGKPKGGCGDKGGGGGKGGGGDKGGGGVKGNEGGKVARYQRGRW